MLKGPTAFTTSNVDVGSVGEKTKNKVWEEPERNACFQPVQNINTTVLHLINPIDMIHYTDSSVC